jgi:hypothetical protein
MHSLASRFPPEFRLARVRQIRDKPTDVLGRKIGKTPSFTSLKLFYKSSE